MNKKNILSLLAALLMSVSSASFATMAVDGPGNQIAAEDIVSELQRP